MHPPCALLGTVDDCRDSVETIALVQWFNASNFSSRRIN
jgi:hypothetical protein